MDHESAGFWCEGCFHPIDTDEATIVRVMKRVGDFEHPVIFHRRCYNPADRLYSQPLWFIDRRGTAQRGLDRWAEQRRRSPAPAVRSR